MLAAIVLAAVLSCSPVKICIDHRLSPSCWRPSSVDYVPYVKFWKKHGPEICTVNQTKGKFDAVVYVSDDKVSPTCFWNNIWWLSDKEGVQYDVGPILIIAKHSTSSKLWAEMLRILNYTVIERFDLSIADQLEYMYTAYKTMSVGGSPLPFAAKGHDFNHLRILDIGLWWADWWIDC